LQDPTRTSPEDTSTLARLVGQSETECNLESLQRDFSPRFLKTHQLAGTDEFPAIVLVRDGRDSLVSFAHFVLKTAHGIDHATPAQLEETMEELIRSEIYGGWGCNVMSWANRVGVDRLVRYEELIEAPIGTLRAALAGIGLELGKQDEMPPSFTDLHEQVPWFFRRGIVGSWRQEMPQRIQSLFLEKNEEAMEQLGYLREDNRKRLCA
jgi:hypothetical protein